MNQPTTWVERDNNGNYRVVGALGRLMETDTIIIALQNALRREQPAKLKAELEKALAQRCQEVKDLKTTLEFRAASKDRL